MSHFQDKITYRFKPASGSSEGGSSDFRSVLYINPETGLVSVNRQLTTITATRLEVNIKAIISSIVSEIRY